MKVAVWNSSSRGLGLRGLLRRRLALPVRHLSASAAAAQAGGAGELVEWVQQGGGSVQGVAVEQYGGEGEVAGFGLKAVQDCRPGACLISLPAPLQLTYDAATSDPRLLALINPIPEELWGAKLALQVLAHRVQGEASPFAPYIANLPVGVPGLPMFFDGEALAALQYPPVTEQVKRRCRWLLSFSQQVLAAVKGTAQDPFGGADVDANALGWALGVVTSRAFRTRGPTQPASMLPLIDMANHSFSPNCKIAAAGGGSLQMVAMREISAGEPVLLSYGNLPNDFLLMDYGFVVPGNPYDKVQLRFDPGLIEAAKTVAGLKAGADPAPWQQGALRTLGLVGEGANTEVSILRVTSSGDGGAAGGGPVDPRLLAAVRVLCARSHGDLMARGRQQPLTAWDAPLQPLSSEIAALRTLSGLCMIALSQFTSSLPDDQAALAAGGQQQQQQGAAQQQQPEWRPLSPNMRLALQFRSDKKQLLLDALEVLAARIKELTVQQQEAAAAAAAGKAAAGGKGKVPQAKHGGKGFGA